MNFKILLICITLFVSTNKYFSQGATCSQATPFCTAVGSPFTYQNVSDNTGVGCPLCPSAGCLLHTPRPSWFYIKSSAAGAMTFSLTQSTIAPGGAPDIDVDFISYGPYSAAGFATACSTGLTGTCTANHVCSGNVQDCSYSAAATETMTITATAPGQYFLIMITNYNGTAGWITFTQTGGPPSDCSITCPSVISGAGITLSTGSDIPSFVTCGSAPFTIKASSNSPFGSPIVPGIMLNVTTNNNATNNVNWYENGSLIANLPLSTNYNYDYQLYYSSPSATTTIEFCETNSIEPDMNYSIMDLASGTSVSFGTWVDDGFCQMITLPPGTIKGVANFTATCGACVTSTDYGYGTFNPIIAGVGTHTITYTFNAGGSCSLTPYVYNQVITVTQPTETLTPTSATFCAGGSTTITAAGTVGANATFKNYNDYLIPDNSAAGVTSTINVSGLPGTVGTSLVSVNLNIEHYYDSDLDIYLVCPSGNTITLSAANGGSGDSYSNTTFGTSGTVITAGTAPFSGTFTPQGAFSGLSGCNINGIWTLFVKDHSSGDVGVIRDWTINFTNQLSYSWTPITGLSSTTGTLVVASPTTTTVYSVTATDAGGCGIVKTVTVNVNPIPVANAGTTAVLTCNTTSLALSGSGGTTYAWTGPASGIASGATTAAPTVTLPGTYSLQVTSAGCTSTISTVTITQNTVVPTVTSSVSAVLNCTATTVNATASTTTAPVSYTWTGSGIASSTTFSTITVNLPGTYNYSVTNTTNGCKALGSQVVTQNTVAPIATSSVSAVLNCTATTVNASATTTTTPASYNWSGSGITSASNISTITVNQPGTFNYTVTNTSNACYVLGNVSVTQNTVVPVVTASVSAVLNCTLSTVNVSATTTTTPVSYNWSGPGITSAANISTITANAAGTYNYTVTAANGCNTTGSQVVIQSAGIPSVSTATSAVLNCTLTTVNASATTTTTPVTYAWSGTGITSATNISTITVNQAGTYNYTVTNTSNGCKATGSAIVTQNTVTPAVTSAVSAVLNCTATTVNASATTTTTPVTYNWSGPGIASSANISTITINQPGTYSYTVTNTSNGCSNINSVIATQNTLTPAVTSTASAVLNCTLSSVNVSATTTMTPVSYNWTGSGITSATNISTITVNAPGTYNYTVTNTSNGCTTTGSQNVIQSIGTPTVNAVASSSLNCTVLTSSVSATTTMTPVSYNWTGTGITSASNISTITVNQPGTYSYTVTNTSNGCKAIGSVAVIQNTVLPNSNATTASIITCTNNTILLNSSPVTGVTYTWAAPGGSSILTSVNNATVNAQGAGIYTVTITDISNNCVKAATVSPTSNTVVITPSVTSTPTLTCGNTTVTLNGAPTSGVLYSWTGPGTIAPMNLANVNINLPGSYVLTATNTANGCVGTVTTSITQNTVAPTLTVSATQTITCASPAVTISGASSPSTCTPSWAGVCGPTSAFTTTACATGTFVLTVTNPANGCTNTGSVTVVSSSGLPAVTASSTGSITCNTFTAQVAATTTASPVSYNWTGPGSITSPTSGTTTVGASGTYICVVTNTSTGCASTITSFVPTNTIVITPTVAPASSITCIATTQTLSASPTGSQYTYTWTGTGITANANTPNPEVNLGGSFVVTITNTISGCVGSNTIVVPQDNAAPTITINPSSYTTTCANPTATLVTNASVSSLTYSWTAPSSGSLNSLTIANPIASGSGIFTVAVTNTVNGCSSSLTQNTVQVVPDAAIPTVTITSNTTSITCSNPTPSVSVTTNTSSVTYNWSPTIGIVAGTETTATPSFSLAGSYSLVVTNSVNSCATSAGGNVVTVGTNTTIPGIALSSLSPANTGTLTCVTHSIAVTPTVNPASNLTYTWSATPGISTPLNQANATFTAAGVYTLAVTNTVTGCVSSSTAAASTYSVYSNSNTPTVTISPTSTNTTIGCGANTSVTFSANAIASGTNIMYNWTPGNITTPSFNATAAGVYVVVVTDAVSQCSISAQFTVTGNSNVPNLTSNANVGVPCGSSSVALSASSTNTNVSYTWTGPAASVITGSTTNSPTVNLAGNYVVTVTDPLTGCSNSNTVSVTQTNINALFTADPTSGVAPLTVNFTNQSSATATNFNWNFGNTNSSTAQNPNTIYNTSGTYTVYFNC